MPNGDDVLAVLRSIDGSLKALVALAQQRQSRAQASAPPAIADDRELDGKYGDPVLKFKPRDWTGESFKNCRFSQCPPELLDLVAESLDYFAKKSDEKGETTEKGKPLGDYKRADAARARGWAKRMREGRVPVPVAAAGSTASAAPPTDWGTPENWT